MYCSDLGDGSCKRVLRVCREYKERVSCPLSTGPRAVLSLTSSPGLSKALQLTGVVGVQVTILVTVLIFEASEAPFS